MSDPDPDGSTAPGTAESAVELHSIGTGQRRAFWADAVADEVEARGIETEPIVIKGGVSPSGVPHIGHLNEIMRGYFVAEALRDRGYAVRQVFTSDDKDRLRAVPRTLATSDWELVSLDAVPDPGVLGRNLGRPLTDVPDPFDCHDSYGAHQTALLSDMAARMGVDIDVLSNTSLYAEGTFESVTRRLLADRTAARDLLTEYQDSVEDDYVPWLAQCAACGHLTETITAVDLDAGTVEYACTDVVAGDRTIEGCDHRGTATLREGKLPWRFEWPAQWAVLEVDHEPFGKDHAEGSWPSGEHIARELLHVRPPTPLVYEWFTYNGEALSSSSGHVITVAEVLELLEVDVFRYFFTKPPRRARDFDIATLDQLVNEFDRFEERYFEAVDPSAAADAAAGSGTPPDRDERHHGGNHPDQDDQEHERAVRAYPMCVDTVSASRPIRLPYTFAAVLGMTDDRSLRVSMARHSGHLPPDAAAAAPEIERALARVERARTWAERTDNEYNYRLAEDCPSVDVDDDEAVALDALATFIETERPGPDRLQEEIFEFARSHDVPVGRFFELGYRLFLDQSDGPRLGPFLHALDRTFVVRRLRREA